MSKTVGQTAILKGFDGYSQVLAEKVVAVDGVTLEDPFYIVSNMDGTDIKVYSSQKYRQLLSISLKRVVQTSLVLEL